MIEITPTMKRFVVFTLIFLAGCGTNGDGPTDSVALLTPEEADELRWPESDWLNMDRDRQAPMGPKIVIHKPVPQNADGRPILETSSPTSFSLSFEANPDPVDMKSLSVRAGRGLLWQNLTPRLESYVKGNSVSAEALTIPEGRFVLKISIDDVNGRTTQAKYRIHVLGG